MGVGRDGAGAAGLRARCRIPESEHHRPKWQLALDMLDELATVGLRPAVLFADTGYGANADFRHGLEDRDLAYTLQVSAGVAAHAESAVPHQPTYGGLGPRPLTRYRTRPVSLRKHVLTQGRDSAFAVTWRKGSKAAMSARFAFLQARLAGRRPKPAPDGAIPLRWLIAQRPEGQDEPVKYWISNLSSDNPRPGPRPPHQTALAHQTRLPRAEDGTRTRPLRGPLVRRLAPSRHPRHRRPPLPDRTADLPISPCQGLRVVP